MKNFCKKLFVFIAIITAVVTTFSIISSNSTFAENRSDGSSCSTFLGMTNWDCGFVEMEGDDAQDELTQNIVVITSNVLTDITVLAAYIIIGYVMYGGYLYMFSSGDPGKAAAGKKALTHAFIGLAIVMSAYSIFSGIRIAIIGNKSFGECKITEGKQCVDGGDMVVNLIQWIGGMAGVVCAIFIVVGGWGYITAAGEPGKLQKAKSTILYALIGLIIVALTEVLTAFISDLIRKANDETGSIETTQVIAITNKEQSS